MQSRSQVEQGVDHTKATHKELEAKFKAKIMDLPVSDVPATNGTSIQRTKDNEEALGPEEHEEF